MNRLLSLSLALSVLGLIGCGGTTATDAAVLGDAGNDASADTVDGGNDAAVADVDSAVDAGHDAAAPVDVGPHDAGPTDQCTNATDRPIAEMSSTPTAVGACGQSSFGAEPTLMNCIVSMTGLSAPCASCYDTEVHCVIAHCISAGCATDPSSATCVACRDAMCHPAFSTCSGLP